MPPKTAAKISLVAKRKPLSPVQARLAVAAAEDFDRARKEFKAIQEEIIAEAAPELPPGRAWKIERNAAGGLDVVWLEPAESKEATAEAGASTPAPPAARRRRARPETAPTAPPPAPTEQAPGCPPPEKD